MVRQVGVFRGLRGPDTNEGHGVLGVTGEGFYVGPAGGEVDTALMELPVERWGGEYLDYDVGDQVVCRLPLLLVDDLLI